MNKQPVIVYVPVSVDEGLPEERIIFAKPYYVFTDNKEVIRHRLLYADSTWDNETGTVTHWLSPQTLITHTPEEWERVENVLKFAKAALESCYDVVHYPANGDCVQDEAIKILNQLNEVKP